MGQRIRQLLLVLMAFAFVGGTSFEFARSAECAALIAVAAMPGDMMMPQAGAQHSEPMAPCKGMTQDCVKQIGCVTDAALPVRLAITVAAAQAGDVKYWPSWSVLANFVGAPEPLPPRTI